MPILLNFETQIKGDSKIDGHEDWISCDQVRFLVERNIHKSGAGTDRNLGDPNCQEVEILKSSDISSPQLMLQACCGKSLKKAEIHFVRTGGADDPPEVFAAWELTDPIVSYFDQSARDHDGSIHPEENIKLNFTQAKLKYVQFDGGKEVGNDEKGFDLKVNKAL